MEWITNKEPDVKLVLLSNISKLLFVDTLNKSTSLPFHGKIQAVFKNMSTIYYDCYNYLQLPLVSENKVSVIVEKFNLSPPFQQTGIQTLLNILHKTKREIICYYATIG